MTDVLREVIVTWTLDPHRDAPDDADGCEVDERYPTLRDAIDAAETGIAKRLDGYATGPATLAVLTAVIHDATTDDVDRFEIARRDRDGWDPGPRIIGRDAIDDDLLTIVGPLGTSVRSEVSDPDDRGPLVRLMLHAATPTGRAPWVCGDCAADDDCSYRAVTMLLVGIGRHR